MGRRGETQVVHLRKTCIYEALMEEDIVLYNSIYFLVLFLPPSAMYTMFFPLSIFSITIFLFLKF